MVGETDIHGDDPSASGEGLAAGPGHAQGRLGGLLAVCAAAVMVVVAYGGGLALYIWTAYLFYVHWGTFWCIAALFLPPVAVVVAAVACFSWGIWFYILAPALWLIAAAGAGLVVEEAGVPRRGVGLAWFAVVVALSVMFVHGAWRHAASPAPMTPELRQELADVAVAVCLVLRDSVSDDPVAASRVAEAKPSLRRQLRRYDERALTEIRGTVDAYLRFDWLLYNDLMAYFRGSSVGGADFAFSKETREAFQALPRRIQEAWGGDLAPNQEAVRDMLAGFGLAARLVEPRHMEAVLREESASRQRVCSRVYADLLGRPMPTLAEAPRDSGGR